MDNYGRSDQEMDGTHEAIRDVVHGTAKAVAERLLSADLIEEYLPFLQSSLLFEILAIEARNFGGQSLAQMKETATRLRDELIPEVMGLIVSRVREIHEEVGYEEG